MLVRMRTSFLKIERHAEHSQLRENQAALWSDQTL